MDIRYGMFSEHPKNRSDPIPFVSCGFPSCRQAGRQAETRAPITSFRFVSPRSGPASVRWGPGHSAAVSPSPCRHASIALTQVR
jgi:hypothetical protein